MTAEQRQATATVPCEVLWCDRHHVPGSGTRSHDALVDSWSGSDAVSVSVALVWLETRHHPSQRGPKVRVYVGAPKDWANAAETDLTAKDAEVMSSALIGVGATESSGGRWLAEVLALASETINPQGEPR